MSSRLPWFEKCDVIKYNNLILYSSKHTALKDTRWKWRMSRQFRAASIYSSNEFCFFLLNVRAQFDARKSVYTWKLRVRSEEKGEKRGESEWGHEDSSRSRTSLHHNCFSNWIKCSENSGLGEGNRIIIHLGSYRRRQNFYMSCQKRWQKFSLCKIT